MTAGANTRWWEKYLHRKCAVFYSYACVCVCVCVYDSTYLPQMQKLNSSPAVGHELSAAQPEIPIKNKQTESIIKNNNIIDATWLGSFNCPLRNFAAHLICRMPCYCYIHEFRTTICRAWFGMVSLWAANRIQLLLHSGIREIDRSEHFEYI